MKILRYILKIPTIQTTNPYGSTFLTPKPHIRNYPKPLSSMSHPHNHFFNTDLNITLPPWPWTSKVITNQDIQNKIGCAFLVSPLLPTCPAQTGILNFGKSITDRVEVNNIQI
jgi:hypothetical protein